LPIAVYRHEVIAVEMAALRKHSEKGRDTEGVMKHMNASRTIGLTLALLATSQAVAWDGTVTGVIRRADVTDGPNYAFRIELQGVPQLCGNANTWAFIDSTTANYNVYVASILAAKAAGDTVVVYSNRDATTGYCRIGYISTNAS
jgi:hypothetical protein